MPTVVGIRLRNAAKTLWFDPAEHELAAGARVVVRTERGEEIGSVAEEAHFVEPNAVTATLAPVLREAEDADLAQAARLDDLEADAVRAFRESVKARGLDMKPVSAEYQFDGSRVVLHFVAEERVDFRELVKDLSARLKTRIDMRQVGVRDEARMVGGIGHCGEVLCCARLAGEFQPVSIRMAKEQDLPLNPLKISGRCGRLMCCLRYEFDAYKDFKGRAPKRGAQVETPAGTAKVTDLNTPRELITMRLGDGTEVKVPLSGLECGGGKDCPCSVSAEAFDAARGASGPLSGASLADAGSLSTASEREGERRERRPRRSRGERRTVAQAGQEAAQPKQQGRRAAAPAPDAPEAEAKPAGTGRRRRRRRGRGGGGGVPGSGAPDSGDGGGAPAEGV